MEKISFIMTHWCQNKFRSKTLRKSLESAIETTKHLPVEFIIFDNGNNKEDSEYLLNLCHDGKINFYTRSATNMYFGFGRNVGLDMAIGDFLVFSDNDILYLDGWLDKSIELLKTFDKDKIAITPLKADRIHRNTRHWTKWFEINKERFPANMRAGSNSWVMRAKDFSDIGRFKNHRIAGTKWTDAFVRAGYTMITMEHNPLAEDLGFKKGYNLRMNVPIIRKFSNGEELRINDK